MGEQRNHFVMCRRARVGLLVVAMVAAACGGSDSADLSEPAPTDAPSVEDDAGSVDARVDEQVDDDDSGDDPDAGGGSGTATLTIADRTWQFVGFQCAFESSGVLNEGTTLGTNILDEADGVRIQMQIDVYNDGTAQFSMDDIEDFENPAFSYLETAGIAVTVDGDTVRAEGEVTDQASETFDVVAMSFEGECGPGSLR